MTYNLEAKNLLTGTWKVGKVFNDYHSAYLAFLNAQIWAGYTDWRITASDGGILYP